MLFFWFCFLTKKTKQKTSQEGYVTTYSNDLKYFNTNFGVTPAITPAQNEAEWGVCYHNGSRRQSAIEAPGPEQLINSYNHASRRWSMK